MVKFKDEQEKKSPRENPKHIDIIVVERMKVPTKEELRALAWSITQSYSTYKKNWNLVKKPAPASLIFLKGFKYLKKSKDPVVKKYLSEINIKFQHINLEEY